MLFYLGFHSAFGLYVTCGTIGIPVVSTHLYFLWQRMDRRWATVGPVCFQHTCNSAGCHQPSREVGSAASTTTGRKQPTLMTPRTVLFFCSYPSKTLIRIRLEKLGYALCERSCTLSALMRLSEKSQSIVLREDCCC